jgi:DNA-binding protein YbaB
MVDRAERSDDYSGLRSMVGDLQGLLGGIENKQRRLLEVVGTAWSDDRMVRAVVGPRGQLVDLELDPRVFRRPDSRALSMEILATVRAAVEDTYAQTQEILNEGLPPDLKALGFAGSTVQRLLTRHDADLEREEDQDE